MWDTRDERDVESSFIQPVPIPPAYPTAEPLHCFRLNEDWIPVVCGALTQLLQVRAWNPTDRATLDDTLGQVMDLIAAISNAPRCYPVRFRLNVCVLEFSEDNGVSWSPVEGWTTYAPGCFTGPAGAVGPAGPAGAVGPAGPAGVFYASAASASGTGLGDYGITSTSFVDVDASSLSLSIPVVAGDTLEIVLFASTYSGANDVGLTVNVGGTDLGDALGLAFDGPGNQQASFTWPHTVVAGEISGGNVLVKARAKVDGGSGILFNRAAATVPHLYVKVINTSASPGIGPAGPPGPTGSAGPVGPIGPVGPAGSPCDCAPPVPPNVRSNPNPQRACDIASFLVTDFIKGALQSTIDGINAGHTILNIFTAVVVALPFDVPVDLGVAALNGLYTVLTSGTLADFEAAEADSSLWAGLTCSVFHAIEGVGYVDSSNFAAMESAICSYSYAHPDVISALCSFVSNLGLSGIQTLQSSGALNTGDCSGCGPWCFDYDFTVADGHEIGFHPVNAEWISGQGWHSVHVGGSAYVNAEMDWARSNLTQFCLTATANSNNGSANRYAKVYDGATFLEGLGWPGGPFADSEQCTVSGPGNSTKALISIGGDSFAGVYPDVWVKHFHATGTGTCPFGSPNC